MKRKIFCVLILALVAFMMILPQYISTMPYILNVFILAFYMTTMSMAWNLLGGMTGQNSIGHACFMGIGAYTATLCIVKFGMNPWVSLPVAIIVTAFITVVVFSQCFILRGPYFTLVTIAFAEAVRQIILNWDFAGKAVGIGLPYVRGNNWLLFSFKDRAIYYYIAFVMMIAVYALMKYIDNSKLGFALKTIREDEDVAAAIGIKPLKYKVIAVVISASVSAVAGFFYACYYRYIDPNIMLQSSSVEIVLPAIIGGSAFVEGPLVGGILMVSLSEYLRNTFGGILPGINLILYAIVLIVVIRFRPTGILGFFDRRRRA
ncbi:MAG: branched-chain amino acid ABC transporter permease [Synergistaceae bacterium]|nr:branched-chain amino acid ABC transporter permease [Synergistaceae bacterium]